jgi:FtsP/CotA-like multicopper oxidase with cupredoxin domain
LRLINAANARVLRLKLEGSQGTVIALDGYPCEPFPLDERGLELATAQRMDVLVDAGPDVFKLQEVSTNQTLTAASFVPDATTRFSFPRPALQLPSVPLPKLELQQARRIPIHMQGGAMGNLREVTFQGETMPLQEAAQQHQKVWAFNGQMMQATTRIADLNLGEWVALELWNDTAWPHAMHLHGHHFWIERKGTILSQKRDTYLMDPGEQARLFFVADNPGLWLFHCHMLEHHVSGMGGVFSVS